jgi:hypothetical protein
MGNNKFVTIHSKFSSIENIYDLNQQHPRLSPQLQTHQIFVTPLLII